MFVVLYCVVHHTTPILRTARLDLVAATLTHLDAELGAVTGTAPHPLEALLDAHVPASWPPGQYDADAIQFFRDRLATDGLSAVGWYGWYAIARADAPERATLVASGGYFGPPASGGVEIGYSVVPERCGQGIATELIAALTDHALSGAEVQCVVAHTDETNIASQTALRRAGFEMIGADIERGQLRFERR